MENFTVAVISLKQVQLLDASQFFMKNRFGLDTKLGYLFSENMVYGKPFLFSYLLINTFIKKEFSDRTAICQK